MSERPLVSCLLATYDFAPYLARSIESVLAQEDYPADRIQLVVVDDGSRDATPDVVAPYLDRITYIRKENGGLRSTVNRGLAEARGELITFHSGDDVWLPHRLARQVAEMERRPELGLLYADMTVIDADDQVVAPSFWAVSGVTPVRGRALPALLRRNVVSGGTLMVRARLAERFAPLPEHAPWEDWWVALRVAEVAEIDYLDEPVFGYRHHGANMNLGAEGQRAIDLVAAELPLRRWMLTSLRSDEPSPADWLAVHNLYAGSVARVAGARGVEPASLVPVTDADRAASARAHDAARAAHAAGDAAVAMREAVRAAGLNPLDVAVLATLREIAAAPEPELRSTVVLADAEALIARPSLLAAYGAVIGAADDVSLAIRVAPERIDALVAAVAAAGLDGDGGADLVAVPAPPGSGLGALAARAVAVLGPGLPDADAAGKRRVGEDDAASLRAWLDPVTRAAA